MEARQKHTETKIFAEGGQRLRRTARWRQRGGGVWPHRAAFDAASLAAAGRAVNGAAVRAPVSHYVARVAASTAVLRSDDSGVRGLQA